MSARSILGPGEVQGMLGLLYQMNGIKWTGNGNPVLEEAVLPCVLCCGKRWLFSALPALLLFESSVRGRQNFSKVFCKDKFFREQVLHGVVLFHRAAN